MSPTKDAVDQLPDFITESAIAENNSGDVKGASDLAHVAVVFDNNHRARTLFGQYDEHLAIVERDLHLEAVARGNEVNLRGSPVATDQARRVLDALYTRIEGGEEISPGDVEGAIRQAVVADAETVLPKPKKRGKLSMASISTARKTIHARTPTQDAYIRAIDRAEMVFGTGPAGTGKTYLAVAYAASLLERGAVDRIILSRPAVEAGERLGFLPGDMKDKVDPYLRPLYDALYDMMPGDKVDALCNPASSKSHRWPSCAAVRCSLCDHSRRGAEHDDHADEDVPDPARRRVENDHNRRSKPD